MNLARDVFIFLSALCIGTLINWAIYAFSYDSSPLNPWAAPPQGLPPRNWLDRLPLIGWWRLKREAKSYGHWFWIRPILIEVAYAAGMVWLFHFETADGLLPRPLVAIPPESWYPIFAVHAILIALLTIATFIDFDEQHIPDIITIPGAVLLLILTTVMPTSHLPASFNGPAGLMLPEPLLFNTKSAIHWPAAFDGGFGLTIALAIVGIWWFSMVHSTMTLRRGWQACVRFYATSFIRHNFWPPFGLRRSGPQGNRPFTLRHLVALIWVVLFLLVAAGVIVTWYVGGAYWRSLLTSLVGLAFAGGIVWGVRIGGYIGLRKEAMGFGDATLMTMIGVAFGWQASLLVFFLSPFTAVIVALAQFAFTRRQDIAFGPYLALAAVVVIVTWHTLWEDITRPYFQMGNLVPLAILFFLLALTGLLWIWRLIKEAIFAALDSQQR